MPEPSNVPNPSPPAKEHYDAIVIGGGPAGSTAALVLARAGASTLVLERAAFPRFHVGESFLPTNLDLIRTLGLEPALRRLPHMPKFGAEFAMGDGSCTTRFSFDTGLDGAVNETFNIERAPFDAMLLDAARDAGAEVRTCNAVTGAVKLADGDVEIESDGRRLSAKYLFDASGQSTFLGKHLTRRKPFPRHRKVAYFGHFRGVERLCGREEGYPTVGMCDEGWFWLIPIDPERTSIGMVIDADMARSIDVPANQMLAWGISRCPFVAKRTARATFPESNHVIADFSYNCAPYSGPGFFLVGDAAVFLDPIFSTGICLGMQSAVHAAEMTIELLQGRGNPARVRRRYDRFVTETSTVFYKLVNHYYDHAFRELFLHGHGPLKVHSAVISILAGHVFPRPAFALRWRYRLFEWLIRLHQRRALVPRQNRFSLLAEPQTPRDVHERSAPTPVIHRPPCAVG